MSSSSASFCRSAVARELLERWCPSCLRFEATDGGIRGLRYCAPRLETRVSRLVLRKHSPVPALYGSRLAAVRSAFRRLAAYAYGYVDAIGKPQREHCIGARRRGDEEESTYAPAEARDCFELCGCERI